MGFDIIEINQVDIQNLAKMITYRALGILVYLHVYVWIKQYTNKIYLSLHLSKAQLSPNLFRGFLNETSGHGK